MEFVGIVFLVFTMPTRTFTPSWTMFNRIIKIGLRGGCCLVVKHAAYRISYRRTCISLFPLWMSGNVKLQRNAATEYVDWSERVQYVRNSVMWHSKFPMHCRYVGILVVWTDERNARLLHLIAHSREGKGPDYRCHLYKKPDFSEVFFNGVRPNNTKQLFCVENKLLCSCLAKLSLSWDLCRVHFE